MENREQTWDRSNRDDIGGQNLPIRRPFHNDDDNGDDVYMIMMMIMMMMATSSAKMITIIIIVTINMHSNVMFNIA